MVDALGGLLVLMLKALWSVDRWELRLMEQAMVMAWVCSMATELVLTMVQAMTGMMMGLLTAKSMMVTL